MSKFLAITPKVDWRLALGLLIGLALLLRLWGIQYGLPFSYWNDEYHELMRAMQLGAGSFNFARSTKGGFYLLLFFEYGIYFVILKITGIVSSAREFGELFARDPTTFYLIGRTTAALFGAATVAAVFWLSRLAFSTTAGLLAAMLLAINVLHVDLSHRIGVDVPMAMLATVSLYFGLRMAIEGRRRDYILAALFAALATTTKLPGILLILPLLIAHTYAVSRDSGVRGWLGSRNLWFAAAVFTGALLLTNPGIIFYSGFFSHLPVTSEEIVDASDLDWPEEQEFFSRPNLYVFYLNALLHSMGWPLFVVSLAAFAYGCWKRTRVDVILISYALINYLVISSTGSENLYYPRYALPIIVVLIALTGRLIADVIRAIPRWRAASGAIAVVIVALWPAAEAVRADYALTQTDTRTLAKDWFEANVPADARVLIEGGKIGPKRETVQLQDSRASLRRRIEYWEKKEPRQAKFLEFKLAAHGGAGYDLELIRLRSVATLDEYAADHVEYFVVRPQFFMMSRKAEAGAARLLESLRGDSRVELIRRFEPESRTRRGPVVEIYRLNTHRELVSN